MWIQTPAQIECGDLGYDIQKCFWCRGEGKPETQKDGTPWETEE